MLCNKFFSNSVLLSFFHKVYFPFFLFCHVWLYLFGQHFFLQYICYLVWYLLIFGIFMILFAMSSPYLVLTLSISSIESLYPYLMSSPVQILNTSSLRSLSLDHSHWAFTFPAYAAKSSSSSLIMFKHLYLVWNKLSHSPNILDRVSIVYTFKDSRCTGKKPTSDINICWLYQGLQFHSQRKDGTNPTSVQHS